MRRIYDLNLKNSDLDLTKQQDKIEEVFKYLDQGGSSKRQYADLNRVDAVSVHNNRILISVVESGESWHLAVEELLASQSGVEACNGEMFEWELVYSL